MNYQDLLRLIEQEQKSAAKVSCLRLDFYQPQRDCVAAVTPFIGLLGCNQGGKTITALSRVRYDATGEYPEWWDGNRTVRGIDCWVCGDTYDTLRDGIQKKLFGSNLDEPGVMQAGDPWPPMIPADMIVGKPTKVQNSGGCLETVKIRHASGGISTITFKSYAQGMTGLASATLDLVAIDEEPKWEILHELVARVMVRNGTILITFTPTHGKTRLYRWLLSLPRSLGTVRFLHQNQAKHLSERAKNMLKLAFADDPRSVHARITGEAVSLSGLVFPFDTDKLWIDPFPIPEEWPRIGGMDIGWVSPTTCITMAQNPNTGEWFGYGEYGVPEQHPRVHHQSILDRFGDININVDTAANQVGDKHTGEITLDLLNKEAHGQNYKLWLPENFWKYQKAERAWDIGYPEMISLLRNNLIYFFKPTAMQDPFSPLDGVHRLKTELEECEWDENGERPKNRNKYHFTDGWRYAVVGRHRAKPLTWKRELPRFQPVEVPEWKRPLGNSQAARR